MILAIFVLALIYRVTRSGTTTWSSVLPGATAATILWWGVNSLFGIYVRKTQHGPVYGGLAAAIPPYGVDADLCNARLKADFQAGSYGYRPKRTAHEAVARVAQAIVEEKTRIIDLDLTAYFDNVQQPPVYRLHQPLLVPLGTQKVLLGTSEVTPLREKHLVVERYHYQS